MTFDHNSILIMRNFCDCQTIERVSYAFTCIVMLQNLGHFDQINRNTKREHGQILLYWCSFSVSDCSFEDGWCGWHNYDDLLATRQPWLMYDCNTNTHGEFNGLGSDVTFSGGPST